MKKHSRADLSARKGEVRKMLLAKLFIKNYRDVENPAVRNAYGKLSGIVGIFCNLLLFAGKVTIGLLSGSVSIQADAFNNLSDASSSVISLLGFKMASRPADEEHPYGHARYEYLSGLFVALFVLVVGVELFLSSLDKILHPVEVDFSLWVVLVLVFSIVLKFWMMFFNYRMGKKISSGALLATSADSRNDVISTTAVLIAAIISHFTSLNLDGWMGIAVALFILLSGLGLVKDTVDPLLGRAPDPEVVRLIEKKIMSYDGVLGMHDLMVHDYGPGRQFASAHVEMSYKADIFESHEILDTIERDFLKDGYRMVLHLDPVVTDDPHLAEVKAALETIIEGIDKRYRFHDLRMVPGKNRTNLVFDLVVPAGGKLDEAKLKKRVSEEVAKRYPDHFCVITVENGYVTIE